MFFSCVKGVSLGCCSAVFIFLRQPAMLPGEGMEGTPCGSSPDVGSAFPQGNIHCLMLLVTPVWNHWIYKVSWRSRGLISRNTPGHDIPTYMCCTCVHWRNQVRSDPILFYLCDLMNVDIKAVANRSLHPQRWVNYLLNIKIRIQYCAKALNQPQLFIVFVCFGFFHLVSLKTCGSLSVDISSIPFHSLHLTFSQEHFDFASLTLTYDWCCVHMT